MSTRTLNISIPNELAEFLEKNPDLSPSKMFQQKLIEIIDNRKDFETKIKVFEIQLRYCNNFIIEKELWKEFKEWKHQ